MRLSAWLGLLCPGELAAAWAQRGHSVGVAVLQREQGRWAAAAGTIDCCAAAGMALQLCDVFWHSRFYVCYTPLLPISEPGAR